MRPRKRRVRRVGRNGDSRLRPAERERSCPDSLLARAARRAGRPAGIFKDLLSLATALRMLFGIPTAALAVLEMAMGVLVFVANEIRPARRHQRALRAATVATLGVMAVGVMLVVFLELDARHTDRAQAAAPPDPARTTIGPGIVEQIRAFHRWFELRRDGVIGVFDLRGRFLTRYRVSGPARSIAECGSWLFVTHGKGRIARLIPASGQLDGDYPYSRQLGDLACWDNELWASKPSKPDAAIVEIDPKTLKDRYGDAITGHVTSIAGGIINGRSGIWVLDGESNELVGISKVDGQLDLVGPFSVGPGATQILYVDPRMWILHPGRSCLHAFDSNSDEEDPGIPLVPGSVSMSASDGDIYIAGGPDVTVIDSSDPVHSERVISMGPWAARLVDANEYAGLVMAADAGGMVIGASPFVQAARQLRSFHAARGACGP